jgi:hypothetical protein
MEQYESGRTTSISHEELHEKARKYLSEYFVSDLDKLKKKASEVARHIVEQFVERKEIRSMDPAKMEPVMEKLQKEDPYIQFAYVVNPEGRKVTRNITDIENKAKYETAGLGDDFSNRSWFINPMKTGKSYVSDFYTSRITGALCITVSAPIVGDNNAIAGVFGVDIRFEDLVRAE